MVESEDKVEQSFLTQLPAPIHKWILQYRRCPPEMKNLCLARLLVYTYQQGARDATGKK